MGSPSIPDPVAPPRVPMPIDPMVAEARRRARKGAKSPYRSTIFSSPLGVSKRASIAAPTLMGGSVPGGSSRSQGRLY